MKKIALGLSSFALLGSMMLGSVAMASDATLGLGSITPAGAQTGPTALPNLIKNLLNAFFGILGIIAVLLVIWSGFQWMTGGAEGVTKAKDRLKNAAIGLLLIMIAYALTNYVISALTTATTATT